MLLYIFTVNSMPLKVTHFGVEDTKQKYNYFNKNSTELQIAPLVATVILYLSNVSAGGQIIFPESGVRDILTLSLLPFVWNCL